MQSVHKDAKILMKSWNVKWKPTKTQTRTAHARAHTSQWVAVLSKWQRIESRASDWVAHCCSWLPIWLSALPKDTHAELMHGCTHKHTQIHTNRLQWTVLKVCKSAEEMTHTCLQTLFPTTGEFDFATTWLPDLHRVLSGQGLRYIWK